MGVYLGTKKIFGTSDGIQIIGQIVKVICNSSYIPSGCLPCDGSEYQEAQFSELFNNYLLTGKLLTCTYAEYTTDLNTYGQTNKFAVDSTNKKFKVPTIKDGSYLTQAKSDSELGKIYKESLPDHTHHLAIVNAGGTAGNAGYVPATSTTVGGVIVNTGTNGAGTNGEFSDRAASGYSTARQQMTNASAENSIYKSGAKVQGDNLRARFFVIVANGQINQSQMNWSNWATSLAGKANDSAVVHKTGDETIAGVKTFSSIIKGTALYAQYADLAEIYEADENYPAGTLVKIGKNSEISIASSDPIAVISSQPGFILNSNNDYENPCKIALSGRVLVRVIGKIQRGDKLVLSSIPGIARKKKWYDINKKVLARALESSVKTNEKLVLCIVNLNLL